MPDPILLSEFNPKLVVEISNIKMTTIINTFKAEDQKEVYYYQWLPENEEKIKGIVQIAHGMAEHGARYDRFADVLIKEGFAVYANDHRGHGKTAGSLDQVGYFEDHNFWVSAIRDMHQMQEVIAKRHPEKPIFLFGHSMGSMLARHYISLYGKELKGVILSSTNGNPGMLGQAGILLAKGQAMMKGRKVKSALLDKLSFGQFNQSFKPNRTDFDWLSRDEAEVDKYINDPYCGTVFSTGFFVDFLEGIKIINKEKTYLSTPKDLPMLLFAGDQDPVGDMGKGVNAVYKMYQKVGLEDVKCTLYVGGRHEMLNETIREEVFADLVKWLGERVGVKK